jgi:hypothetical protein
MVKGHISRAEMIITNFVFPPLILTIIIVLGTIGLILGQTVFLRLEDKPLKRKKMSKLWKPNPFKHLEPTVKEFQKDLEKKLDDRDGWRPNSPPTPEIGGERAIPLEEDEKNK